MIIIISIMIKHNNHLKAFISFIKTTLQEAIFEQTEKMLFVFFMVIKLFNQKKMKRSLIETILPEFHF